MLAIDFSTDQMIIVNFPAFSGGKFIMNCLSLSKHAVPQNRKIAAHLVNHPTDYNYRLNAVLSTLPPVHDMKSWREKWEFGDTEFFQGSFATSLDRWKLNKNSNNDVDRLLVDIINNKMYFFVTCHGGAASMKSKIDVWPNAKIISLINSEKFWKIAINLKQPSTLIPSIGDYAGNECKSKYSILKGSSWPDWELFELYHYDIDAAEKYVTINEDIKKEIKEFYKWHEIPNQKFCFDVDRSFFVESNFLQQMQELYNWLGFDDYNSELLSQYYRQYISLHKPKES